MPSGSGFGSTHCPRTSLCLDCALWTSGQMLQRKIAKYVTTTTTTHFEVLEDFSVAKVTTHLGLVQSTMRRLAPKAPVHGSHDSFVDNG